VSAMPHEHYLDLCAGQALDCLDVADREELEAHLRSGCPECEAALGEFSRASVLLAASSSPVAAASDLRDRVLAAALEARPGRGPSRVVEGKPARPLFAWTSGFAAAAAVLAVVAVFGWIQAGRLARELSSLRIESEANRDRIAGLEAVLDDQERWRRVLGATDARVAVLSPTPAGQSQARGRAVYDPGTRRAVVVLENLQVPSGRDYQLWAIRGAAPVSLGLIKVDTQGKAEVHLEDVGGPESLNAFAVSLEQAGGSPNPTAPTGPVVMLGKLAG